ncbi:MAG: hypothetical protein JRN15_18935, partial [Nitrososphaerota archaeon]|nr:hypothetical protein [Nitrososphaerota archaeon]
MRGATSFWRPLVAIARHGSKKEKREMKNLFFCLGTLTVATFASVALAQSGQWIIYNSLTLTLPDNNVTAITVDGSGNKWIGMQSGWISKFNGAVWTNFNPQNTGITSNQINSIAIDRASDVWAASNGGGLGEYNGTGWTIYTTSNSSLPSNAVYSLNADQLGNVWVGTSNGLAKFNGLSWTIYSLGNLSLPNNSVYCIAIDKNGKLWLGTSGGLVEFDGVNWTVYDTSNSSIPDNIVDAIAVDSQNRKWIGTGSGSLTMLSGSTWQVWSGIPSSTINSIAVDSSGNKWLAIAGQGLYKFDGSSFTSWSVTNSSLPDNNVTAVAADDSGNVLVGTINATGPYSNPAGLAEFNGVSWTIFSSGSDVLGGDDLAFILIDNSGNKWISTSNRLLKCDGKNWIDLGSWGANGNEMLFDKQNNLWVATPNGLVKYNGTTTTTYTSSNSPLPSSWVQAVAQDSSGNIWVGVYESYGNSLLKFDGARWTAYTSSNSPTPANYFVWSISVDPRNEVWVGWDNGGVTEFNGSSWMTYTSSNSGLPNDWVRGVLCDTSGKNYFATAPQMASLNGTTWNTLGGPAYGSQTMVTDSNDNLWIGSGDFNGTNTLYSSGLWKFDGSSWTNWNTSNSSVPSNNVTSVAIDKYGNKWIATWGGGLAVF